MKAEPGVRAYALRDLAYFVDFEALFELMADLPTPGDRVIAATAVADWLRHD